MDYARVFLALLAIWCFAGRFFATRPVIAKAPTLGCAGFALL
ncbi:hypothetical protein ACW4TU_00550 [Streptomyces sp. QTS52]